MARRRLRKHLQDFEEKLYIQGPFFACMIKWILFDLGNVIVKHVLEGKKDYAYNGRILPGPEIESVYSLAEFKKFSMGELTESEFVQKFLETSNLKLSISEFLEVYTQDITPIRGMKELLEDLSPKYSLSILTNEGKEWADRKIDHQKIRHLFKKIIISADLHELKSSQKFYLKSLNMLDAKPEECLFIDDREKNCRAAEILGINKILFFDSGRLKKELASFSITLD